MPLSRGVLFGSFEADLPAALQAWLEAHAIRIESVASSDQLLERCLRGLPRLAIIDARTKSREAVAACRALKWDAFTAVVPTILLCGSDADSIGAALESLADEILAERMSSAELVGRLELAMRRSDRDVQAHPSTRLPGTVTIEAEIVRRMASGDVFAVCYADLDHFKEFNDRYGYAEGDRVIRVLARVLHDVVRGLCGEHGFVGHIGGDDFIFIIPARSVPVTCGEVLEVFDTLVPWQYSESDRRAGYYFGKDRRGQLHRVPLMTLSVGVVTNERRHFTSAAQVSELASEMKGYAKTLPGSIYSIDRRQDLVTPTGEGGAPRAIPESLTSTRET